MGCRFFITSLLALIYSGLFGQTGNYFLTHHAPPDERIDFRSKALAQDAQGEVYFATKAGVLEFDGRNWKLIRVPASVYTISVSDKQVFLGGLRGAGKLTEKTGSPRVFKDLDQTDGVFSSTVDKTNVYFCNAKKILIYSLDTQSLVASIDANATSGNFLGLHSLAGSVFVGTDTKRLFKIENKQLAPFEFPFTNLIFSEPLPGVGVDLIGTHDNRVYVLQNNAVKEIILEQSDFLTHNILVDGVWVSPSVIALATLRGGVIFVNVETGVTEQIVDYESGLPDNEVFALMSDSHGGVWVSHEYGYTRIAPNLPFRSFTHYPGLEGNLLCVQTYKGSVFVGTSLGLFQLVENGKVASAKNQKLPSPVLMPKQDIFEFRQINLVEGKVTQLTEIDGALYVSGAGGVYKVDGDNNTTRLLNDPVHYLFYSPFMRQVLIANIENRVRTFELSSSQWRETQKLDTLNSYITHIFEDKLENVWLCGGADIFKVETVDHEIADVIKYPIQNPMLDETVGFGFGNETYVVSSGQFKKYNGSGFESYDSLASGGKYFASAGNFWFNDGARWRSINRNVSALKLEWLGVFESLRFLSLDVNDAGSLWVITDKNELYKFISTKTGVQEKLYPLFLREVRGNEIQLAKELLIDQSQGAVSFEFIRPDFVGAPVTQYRYNVKGLSNQWSNWAPSNNVIDFSYLPAGKYQLEVQSKNLLGIESNIEQISFKVLLPYWKRWWFYALEFFLFSFLVLVSVRLARANSRYRFLSEILTILTVIMLIQFIQTVITSMISVKTSPVMDFFVQVSIALLVFPVEMLARRGMQKITQTKSPIEQLLDVPRE